MMTLRSPPLPANVDLRDFHFMPLQVERLRRSRQWLIAKRRPEIGFYSINLWMAAWHEVPAGSLENDDDVLADLAMCSPENWLSVKDDVLRGWIRCTDGRLYHETVCEKAVDAWNDKLRHRWGRDCARLRKDNERRRKKGEPELEMPLEPEKVTLDGSSHVTHPGARRRDENPGQAETVTVTSPDVTASDADVTVTSHDCPREIALKGQGQRQGLYSNSSELELAPACDDVTVPGDQSVVVELRPKPAKAKKSNPVKTAWPDDLELTADLARHAEISGYHAPDLWQKFHDKALANGWAYVDWRAAWRNFVQQEVKFDGQYRRSGSASARGRPPDV